MDTKSATAPVAPSESLCGLSRCRRPLPARTGKGPRYEYCPDRIWTTDDSKTYSCRDLGHNEKTWAAVFGIQAPDGAAVAAELHAGLQALGAPLGKAVTTVEATERYLSETVTANEERAASAEAVQREAEQNAQTAQARAERARQAQQAAEEAQQVAEQRTRQAETDRDRAQHEAAAEREGAAVARGATERLEIDNEHLRAEVDDAQSRANTGAARAERAETLQQANAEELDRLRVRLENEQREWASERTRITEQLNRVSTDYAVRLDELQQSHAQIHERTVQDHTRQVADLQRQLGHAEARAEHHAQTRANLQQLRCASRMILRAVREDRLTQARELLERQVSEDGSEPAEVSEVSREQVQGAAQALAHIDTDGQVVQLCMKALEHQDGVLAEGVLSADVMDSLAREGLLQNDSLTALAREVLPLVSHSTYGKPGPVKD